MPVINILEGDLDQHIRLALKSIRDGYVIALPSEHGYIFAADAFSEFAVRAMHVLRGDPLGVAAQVMIPSSATLTGLAREITDEVQALASTFWPGVLSLTLRPNISLQWDLGDNKELDRVSLRVPSAPFLLRLLQESGPLAVASAARAGEPPALSVDRIKVQEFDCAAIFDAGPLSSGPLTTIVQSDSKAMTIIREGAITREQLAAVVPALSGEQPIG